MNYYKTVSLLRITTQCPVGPARIPRLPLLDHSGGGRLRSAPQARGAAAGVLPGARPAPRRFASRAPWAWLGTNKNRMSQKWSRRPRRWVSGLHLWQAPRTAQSTRRFGVRGVTCSVIVHYLPQCNRHKPDVTEVVQPPPDHA